MNAVYNALIALVLTLFVATFAGCAPPLVGPIAPTPPSTQSPVAPTRDSAILAPFAGEWVLDYDKTQAAQEEAGNYNELSDVPDTIVFLDYAMIGAGSPNSEYTFFEMHPHNSKVCGKAWYEEHRFDFGDKIKCHVRLIILEDDLHFEVNRSTAPFDKNDPDFVATPPLYGDVSKCDADKQKPSDWVKYIYSRRTGH